MKVLTRHVKTGAKRHGKNTSLTRIEAALQCISPDIPRDDWFRVGMAIHHELGDAGFGLFDSWSSNGQTYQAKDAKSTWGSFKPVGKSGTITIATLYHMAGNNGYRPQVNGLSYHPLPRPQKPTVTEPDEVLKQQEARHKAEAYWDKGTPATKHPYTEKKGLKPDGLRVTGEVLNVPMYNKDEQISSVQKIQPDGNKRNLKGCETKGCYYPIGKPKRGVLYICEGWATGKSIHDATGHAVAVAFSCGNLGEVTRIMREKFPFIMLVIAADNDKDGDAIIKAEEAALQYDALVVFPEFSDD